MHHSHAAVLVIAACVLLADAVTAARADRKAAREFHERACASYPPSASRWHVTNLYDCKTRKLYVPYQLWTGAKWDGRKDGPCMHEADSAFDVNGFSRTTIRGPAAVAKSRDWQEIHGLGTRQGQWLEGPALHLPRQGHWQGLRQSWPALLHARSLQVSRRTRMEGWQATELQEDCD